jgi:hypothetical protein
MKYHILTILLVHLLAACGSSEEQQGTTDANGDRNSTSESSSAPEITTRENTITEGAYVDSGIRLTTQIIYSVTANLTPDAEHKYEAAKSVCQEISANRASWKTKTWQPLMALNAAANQGSVAAEKTLVNIKGEIIGTGQELFSESFKKVIPEVGYTSSLSLAESEITSFYCVSQ